VQLFTSTCHFNTTGSIDSIVVDTEEVDKQRVLAW